MVENRKALIMANKSINEPCDPTEVRFLRLKQQAADINYYVNLLIVALRNKLGIYGEDWGSNVEVRSEGGLADQEDIENRPKKEPRKDQPSLSAMNQSLFKMEEKLDIKPYHGEIDALKLNHWLQQLEFYFNIHQIEEGKNISFTGLKLEGHAFTWWES